MALPLPVRPGCDFIPKRRVIKRFRKLSPIFSLVLLIGLLVALFSLGGRLNWFPTALLVVLAMALVVLGLVVVVLTVRLSEIPTKRVFFVLAGASAAGMPICALLHNVVYALCILGFGQGFLERHGRDEPVFFILAIVICPALFVVGSLSSMVFLAKDFQRRSG
jgi:hypothetical protein